MIKLISIVLVIIIIISGIYYFGIRKIFSPSSVTVTNTTSSPSPIQATKDLNGKVVYAVQKADSVLIYASDYTGNQTQIAQFDSIESPILSPDKKKLVYRKSNDLANLYIHDFSSGKDRSFTLTNTDARIGNFTWNPDSKQIVFILTAETKKGDPMSSTSNQLGLLDINSGNIEMIDLTNTPMANVANLEPLQNLIFFSSSQSTLYIFENGQCAPGPCYNNMYSFDLATHKISKLLIPDSQTVTATSNPANGKILLADHGLEIYSDDKSYPGKLQEYDPSNNSLRTLVSDKGFVFSYQDAGFINENLLLYSKTQTVDPSKAAIDKAAEVPTNWYILDLRNNSQRQIPYTGFDLKPLTENIGIIETHHYQNNELSLINLTTGAITNLYQSKDANYILLNKQ